MSNQIIYVIRDKKKQNLNMGDKGDDEAFD